MIKENMYVRCSIETEMPDEPRDFATGFVTKIDEFAETAEIVFYDMYNLKRYYQCRIFIHTPFPKYVIQIFALVPLSSIITKSIPLIHIARAKKMVSFIII